MKESHSSETPRPVKERMEERRADHAETLERMVNEAPTFRPGATNQELVEAFADGVHRWPAFLALYERGESVLPAIREGFLHGNWQVRRWCAMFTDHFADAETLEALLSLVRDPKADVRLWAVHSLACESCKDGPNPIDAVPILLERLETDESIRVRRQAAAMLAHHGTPDPRVTPVFRALHHESNDRKLRLHVEEGLRRYAEAGLLE